MPHNIPLYMLYIILFRCAPLLPFLHFIDQLTRASPLLTLPLLALFILVAHFAAGAKGIPITFVNIAHCHPFLANSLLSIRIPTRLDDTDTSSIVTS